MPATACARLRSGVLASRSGTPGGTLLIAQEILVPSRSNGPVELEGSPPEPEEAGMATAHRDCRLGRESEASRKVRARRRRGVLLVWLLILSQACTASPPRSGVWLGTAPLCEAREEDCAVFGLTYVRSDASGDGLPCLRGTKVLCEVPEIRPAPPRADRATRFTVVQYNIMDRPFWVGHDGQRERVCRIPQALARSLASREHIDVIVFNESFSGICAEDLGLRDLLSSYGWRHHLPVISAWWKPSNGGIFIASKWPVVASRNLIFRACRSLDCLAAKGVQYARIEKTVGGRSKVYHVFGTHLQARRGSLAAVQRRQAVEMAEFVERQRIPRTEAVVLAGDFNVHGPSSSEFKELLAILKAALPPLVGNRRASLDVDNTLFGRGPWWVDYVLSSTAHQRPLEASTEILALKTEQEFAICLDAGPRPYHVGPYAPACAKTVRVRDLSDHYPVIGRFEYAD